MTASRPSHRQITPRALRNAFLATEVTLKVEGQWVPAEDAAAMLRSPVFVITAWNPFSSSLSKEENDRRNESLRNRLIEEGATFHPAIGRDPSSSWSEESFGVEGIGRKKARKIGKDFEQHAIFELGREELIVLGCTGEWSERRLYGEWEPGPESTMVLAEAVEEATGVVIESRFARASERGWVHDDGLGAPCPNCGEPLELFGCELEAKDGTPYRAMVYVCVQEEALLWPNKVIGEVRAAARTRRAYLQARADADAQGLTERNYWAYCIELADGVGERPPGLPWIYVGQTSATPEERFEQHRSGYKASKFVRRFGVRLRPDLYEGQPDLRTKPEAETYEAWLAASLTAGGWPVKGGH